MNPAQRMRGNGIAWLAAITCLWFWTWRHLSVEWLVNEQYRYGFAVPFFFLFLLRRNWRGEFSAMPSGWKINLALGIAWLVFLLAELLRRQDPIWRMTGATMVFSASLVTICWLYRCGGLALIRRLWFPLAFAWLAIPWPVPLELLVTQNLLKHLVGVTADTMNGFGVAALQRNNIIELSNGIVGLDTACSGVQSLQAAFFVSLLLGEFYRLGWMRRLGLLLGGWLIALLANFGRVMFLVWTVHTHGENAMIQHHDMVGYTASFFSFACILLLAGRLESPSRFPSAPSGNTNFQKETSLTGIDGYFVSACFLSIPIVTWLWFSSLNPEILRAPATPLWSLNSGPLPADWKVENIEATPSEKASLGFTEMQGLRLTNQVGQQASILHFYWKNGNSMPSFAFFHTPQICMPLIGWEVEKSPAPVMIKFRGIPVPGMKYQFQKDGVQEVAFRSLGAGGKPSFLSADLEAMSRVNRIARLWQAPQAQVNEELLIYLPYVGSSEKQTRIAEEMLDRIVRMNCESF